MVLLWMLPGDGAKISNTEETPFWAMPMGVGVGGVEWPEMRTVTHATKGFESWKYEGLVHEGTGTYGN